MNINKLLHDNPVSCRYGAPMGAVNYWGDEEEPLYLQKVRIDSQGYAPDGTYWGLGLPLWCAFNDETRVYVRAINRKSAMTVINFHRPHHYKRGER